jgi:hypothetical protein
MIRILNTNKIPNTWVFEYYCNLNEKLHGQDLKIKSLFKPTERTPSMCIYYKNDEYLFKDFSTGYVGDSTQLVQKLFKLNYSEAIDKLTTDFNKLNGDPYEHPVIKQESKFKVTSHIKRKWNVLDQKYWTQFRISSKYLEKYNVFPLELVIMSKNLESNIVESKLKGQYMYGYFKANGELSKVYRPKAKSLKFINVKSFIQGSDQLTYESNTLILCSSMKDGLALMELNLNVEFVAPNSENTMIPRSNLAEYMLKYDNLYTLFDNDEAGHKAMEKYKNDYGIQGLYLNLAKDVADSIKDFGSKTTKMILKTLIPNT